MKPSNLFYAVLSGVILFSCAKSNTIDLDNHPVRLVDLVNTKSYIQYEDLGEEDYVVSLEEANQYANYRCLEDKTIVGINKVELFDYDGKPIVYGIDYDEGWEIISADKRGPVVLVSSETGQYEDGLENEGVSAWINSLAGDIIIRQNDKDHWSNISEEVKEAELSCMEFWDMIAGDKDFIANNRIQTKIEDLPSLPIDDGGYWEMIHSQTEYILYDSIPHLLTTNWSQNSPYNYYCPRRDDGQPGNAPAGCVAIAAAQMLYFLHYNIGVPSTTKASATWVGDIHNYYMTFSGSSSTIWSSMDYGNTSHNSYDDSSILIAHVGMLVGMSYGNTSSSAYTSDLIDRVFEPYGITCTYANYNATTVKNNLLNGMPVIVGAYGQVFLGIPSHGHAFVVDGYCRYRRKTTATYEWVWTDGQNHGSTVQYQTTTTWSSPFIRDIQINMGWGGINDYHYALSGDWKVTADDGTELNFIHYREMITNFAEL